jgi:hypothetical protein
VGWEALMRRAADLGCRGKKGIQQERAGAEGGRGGGGGGRDSGSQKVRTSFYLHFILFRSK